ncbi:MAG TPA: TIGR02594 family protein, partial [Flavobacteriales bacterium]|nr:TIGR02594 family protein [Flavobacteriales bacterium]
RTDQGWAQVTAHLLDGRLSGWVSAAHIEPWATAVLVVEPDWLPIARAEVGVNELPGPEHNPRIIGYHATTTLRATTDETAWCSAFVNWCVTQAGHRGTNSAAARSWLTWGRSLAEPAVGSIAVFRRGGSPTSGHVAFFLERRGKGIMVLGGNQSNCVRVSSYPAQDLLGYRMNG